ncbi:hypothetical protein H4Q26_003158 [Puccinia striiformis f. sp. tritici PST-130]|nr:hypothetical protein H4Q26_003158 [Puccinia striiformis f. sp. tritici PST-130]
MFSSIRLIRRFQLQSKFNHPNDNRPSFIRNNMTSPSIRKEIDSEVNWSTPLPSKSSPSSSNAPNLANENDEIKIYTYLVVAPDLEDSNRLKLRAEHFKMAQEGLKTGRIVNAGAMLDSDPTESNDFNPKMIGSWLLVKASSIEEAKSYV